MIESFGRILSDTRGRRVALTFVGAAVEDHEFVVLQIAEDFVLVRDANDDERIVPFNAIASVRLADTPATP